MRKKMTKINGCKTYGHRKATQARWMSPGCGLAPGHGPNSPSGDAWCPSPLLCHARGEAGSRHPPGLASGCRWYPRGPDCVGCGLPGDWMPGGGGGTLKGAILPLWAFHQPHCAGGAFLSQLKLLLLIQNQVKKPKLLGHEFI